MALASPHSPTEACRPLIIIYQPHKINGHICSKHTDPESVLSHLQQLGTNVPASAAEHDGPRSVNCAHSPESPPLTSSNKLNDDDEVDLDISSTLCTPSVERRAQKPNDIAHVHSFTSISTLPETVDLSQQLSEDNNDWASDTALGNLLEDPELFSMFSNDNLGHENSITGTENDLLFSTSSSTAMSASSSNQMTNNTTAPALASLTSLHPPTHVAPQATAALPTTNNTSNRFNCIHPGCNASFNRHGDLRRHDRVHGPPGYACSVNGCARRGMNAFYRRDKLLDHQRRKHGMAV